MTQWFPSAFSLVVSRLSPSLTRDNRHARDSSLEPFFFIREREPVIQAVTDICGMSDAQKTCIPPNALSTDVTHSALDFQDERRMSRTKDEGKAWVEGKSAKVLEGFFIITVVGAFQVAAWRGIWQVTDEYVFPEHDGVSAFFCFVVGHVAMLPAIVFAHHLQDGLGGGTSTGLFVVISRLYTAVCSVLAVWQWRGTWHLLNYYIGTSWEGFASTGGVSLVAMILLQIMVTIPCPPYGLEIDFRETYFSNADISFFGIEWKGELHAKYVVDRIFAVFITFQPAIVFWRAIWGLQDLFFFPENLVHNFLASLVLGVVVTAVAFVTRTWIRRLTRERKGISRLVIEYPYVLFCAFGCISLWRGIWEMFDICLIPDDYSLSNKITAVVGLIGMMAMYIGNTIACRGLTRDGKGTNGHDYHRDYFEEIWRMIKT
ncbi:unnamed protein product [Notodromas monacha]|uniref:Uncharacterized protein n=1 Tax=Notodromas monacha TaxID=399045 RepID=A0A7R9BEN0_9CRUS|nr:unnamed protein product [Notodromas monacha]CAG0913262.1 unnamed protein product [Notodromas monacha]